MPAPARRPNFLVILTDQHRFDGLACAWPAWRAAAGAHSPLRTPHLDRLAAGGVRLDRHYVNNPLCMPGRSTLITGLTPRAHGVRTNGIDLDRGIPTIVQALAGAGYRTHSTGKTHFRIMSAPNGADPLTLHPYAYPEARPLWENGRVTAIPTPYYGFQTVEWSGGHGDVFGDYRAWLRGRDPDAPRLLTRQAGTPPASGAEQAWKMAIPPEWHYNTWVADRTIALLESVAGGVQPFFAVASFPDPHHPFATPDPWFSRYDREAVPPPVRRAGELEGLAPFFGEVFAHPLRLSGRMRPTRTPDDQLREIVAITYGMISFVDQQVGRILDALDRLGLAEETVVLFTADHGDLLGDHWLLNKGPFHFDGLLRVPSLWRFPGRFRQGAVSEALTSHLDVAPTVLDLAGLPAPEAPPAGGEAPRWPPALETETDRQLRALPGRSLAPLLRGEVDRVQDAVLVENDEDYLGLRLRTLVTETHQLTVYAGEDGLAPFGELFDLRADPGQVHNLWDAPGQAGLKLELQARLLGELVRTDARLPRRQSHA
jgi:arylsulfatase A-like enzyme